MLTHRNADFDAFGAMVAVRLMDPGVLFYFPGGQEVALRSFLASGLYPYNEIRKRDLDRAPLKKVTLVDCCDITENEEIRERILSEKIPVTIYDHHREKPEWCEELAPEHVFRPRGSTCTILTEILLESGMTIPSMEATILLMGIHEDTGHLLFTETTIEDIQATEILVRSGADLALARRFAHKELTPAQLGLLNELVNRASTTTIQGHRVTISTLNLDRYVEDLAYIVHKYVDLFQEDVFVGLFNEGNKIFMIGRSRHPDVDISSILSEFSGGGHPAAAAGVVRDRTIVELRESLLKVLAEKLPPRLCAENIMSPHIYGVTTEETISVACSLLNRHRINAMPVFESGKVVGSLTRQLVDRAMHHDLKEMTVRDMMLPPPPMVPPGTSLKDISLEMQTSGVRFALVQDDAGKLKGVVTRMEVYRHLLPVAPEIKKHLEERLERLHPNRSSITRIMKREFTPETMNLLQIAGEFAAGMEMKAYLIGGMVRDMFLGYPDEDIDIVVEGDGIMLAKKLAEHLGVRLRTHEKFLTAKIIQENGCDIDIATARSEYYRFPAALPSVQASVLRQDLYRRDFTINTLAIALNPDTFGNLVDFFGGYQDLKSRHIRIIHSLSFIEDPTRSLRAVKLAVRLGFALSSDTRKLIMSAADRGVFDHLSGNRFWEELQGILTLPKVKEAVDLMESLDLLKVIHPVVKGGETFRKKLFRIREVLSWASIEKLHRPFQDLLVLIALLEGVPDEDLETVAERLDFRGRLRTVILRHRDVYRRITYAIRRDLKRSEAYLLLKDIQDELLFYVMAISEEQTVRDTLYEFLEEWRDIRLMVAGKDLLSQGIPSGPHIGRALTETLLAKLDGQVTGREEEMTLACNLAREYSGVG